jgi:F-type H+-transporting ATPase subunit a
VQVLSSVGATILAEGPFPPSVDEFYPPSLLGEGGVWLTKITALIWLSIAAIIVFFLLAYRNPKLVPTKTQWMAESFYGFIRNNIAKDLIGHEGVRFAPYLATLFAFILLNNLFGLIPPFQLSPMSHIAFPIVLAAISYVMFIYLGIRKHGAGKFFKNALIPPAPWFMLPLLILIEGFSTFIVRPVTLALRLFANMFAGHMILLVFTLGGFALLNADSLFVKPLSLLSWVLTLALFALEVVVAMLQAYVFVVLTSSYIQGALAEEH